LAFKNIFGDFCQTNFYTVYVTDLYEICRDVDEQSEVIFSIPQGTLPWQPILWAKSTSNTHLVVRVTFARAAPPAYDKKGNCCAGRRQTNYLIRWTQANQLNDQLAMISRRRWLVGWSRVKRPTRHISEAVFTANHLTDTDKQNCTGKYR